MGRKSIKSDIVVRKLEEAFEDGLNVVEACSMSGISRDTYYRWLNEDCVFSDRMYRSQLSLTSKAKSVIAKAIAKGDIGAAKWLLDKEKRKSESSTPKTEASQIDKSQVEVIVENTQLEFKKLVVSEMNLFILRNICISTGEIKPGSPIAQAEVDRFRNLDLDEKYELAMNYSVNFTRLNGSFNSVNEMARQ
jgi:hypothetical protein